jgi:hypothetical protein
MISPIIFCTIVLGIGSIVTAAKVGRVGLLATGYFLVMSTFALLIGLVVGNLLQPGEGLHLDPASSAKAHQQAQGGAGTVDFLLGIVPRTLGVRVSPRVRSCRHCWWPCSLIRAATARPEWRTDPVRYRTHPALG